MFLTGREDQNQMVVDTPTALSFPSPPLSPSALLKVALSSFCFGMFVLRQRPDLPHALRYSSIPRFFGSGERRRSLSSLSYSVEDERWKYCFK